MRTVLVLVLSSLWLGGVLACKPAEKPVAPTPATPTTATTPTTEPAPDERVTAADQACAQDNECALTTADCCGCSSLGKQIGVRADRVADLAKRREPVCGVVQCAQQLSDDPSCTATKAVCRGGRCEPDVGGAATMKPTPVEPIPPG